jgi:hypothetical protein
MEYKHKTQHEELSTQIQTNLPDIRIPSSTNSINTNINHNNHLPTFDATLINNININNAFCKIPLTTSRHSRRAKISKDKLNRGYHHIPSM